MLNCVHLKCERCVMGHNASVIVPVVAGFIRSALQMLRNHTRDAAVFRTVPAQCMLGVTLAFVLDKPGMVLCLVGLGYAYELGLAHLFPVCLAGLVTGLEGTQENFAVVI